MPKPKRNYCLFHPRHYDVIARALGAAHRQRVMIARLQAILERAFAEDNPKFDPDRFRRLVFGYCAPMPGRKDGE